MVPIVVESTVQQRLLHFNEELKRRKDPEYASRYHYDKLEVDIEPDGSGLVNTQQPIDYINEYQSFLQSSV